MFVIGVAALCAVAGLARAAEAQIYSWRDASGVLTLSDRPQTAAARALTVPVGSQMAVRSSARYEPLIRQHATQQRIRPELVRAVIQMESAFNPRAVSAKGAMGLMQLMPATAKQFGVIDPFNPAENIRAGVSYLRQLLDRYGHNEQLALAAYNAGPAAVDKYGSTVPPYKETQNYVPENHRDCGQCSQRAGRADLPGYGNRQRPSGREIHQYKAHQRQLRGSPPIMLK